MAINWKELDAKLNMDEINKNIATAKENTNGFEPLPDGYYFVKLENLELGETKDGRPMVKWQFRIVDSAGVADMDDNNISGDNSKAIAYMSNYKPAKKPCIFMNRVVYGNRVTDRWNDGVAINGVLTWLQKLTNTPHVFRGYAELANELEDILVNYEDFEILVKYEEKAFYPVSIMEVYTD